MKKQAAGTATKKASKSEAEQVGRSVFTLFLSF
jgi:hypothetical protein